MKRIVKLSIKWFFFNVIVIFGVLFMSFLIFRLMPGDPVINQLPPNFTPEEYIEKRNELGLDKPFFLQYFYFLGNLFFGNLLLSLVILFGLSLAIALATAFIENKFRKPKE